MTRTEQIVPLARKDDLVVQEVPDETLVYDLKSHRAHCLNRTAAMVWKHCDGRRTVAQIIRHLERALNSPVSPEMVWHALNQLEKSGLLEERLRASQGVARISRRELVRRLCISTTIAVPLVTSIIAPTAVQAATVTCGGVEASCGPGKPPCCAPLFCVDGIVCRDIR